MTSNRACVSTNGEVILRMTKQLMRFSHAKAEACHFLSLPTKACIVRRERLSVRRRRRNCAGGDTRLHQ